MPRHLLPANSTTPLLALALTLALGACGGITAPDESTCAPVEVFKTIVLPADETNSLDVWVSGQCLETSPTIDATGRAECVVIAARSSKNGGAQCDTSDGLRDVEPEHADAIRRIAESADAKANGWNVYCELIQLDPASVGGQACRTKPASEINDENGNPARGFCYLDATTTPPIGDPQLVQTCENHEQRAVRFTGSDAIWISNATKSLTVVCSHEVCSAP